MDSMAKGSALVWRRRIVRAMIVFLVLLNVLLFGVWYSLQPQPNSNALAIGSRAISVDEPIKIDLRAPADLNYKTRTEVLNLRREAVNRYPGLLAAPYAPSDIVFKQIEDSRPWWGIPGEFYYGPGNQSILGASEESRFILNPYLLVAAEFYGLGIWSDDGGRWDKARITEQDLGRPDFPYYCPPEGLRWSPRASRGEVTYDVTRYLVQLNQWTTRPYTLDDVVFGITAYNARDLNLNYIQLAQADSTHVKLAMPFDTPIPEPEFLHRGGSCQYPGGCNNASPDVPQFDDISIEALPAQLTVYLWKEKPVSAGQLPDLTFTLHFK